MTPVLILCVQISVVLFIALLLEVGWRMRTAGAVVVTAIRWLQALLAVLCLLLALNALTSFDIWHSFDWVRWALSLELANLGGTPLTPTTALTVVGIIAASWWASVGASKAVETVLRRQHVQEGTIAALAKLCHYFVMGVGLAVGLSTLGLNLSALFAASAVFAVGFGLAMQQVAENFVSGIILLVERSIRPGDILNLNGSVVRVQHLGIRSTVVRTQDDAEIIVPNSKLVQNEVTNLRLSDTSTRVRVVVGVAYESDLRITLKALERAGASLPSPAHKPPVVVLRGFGESSVDFEVSVWIDDPWRLPAKRSELSFAIWDALKEDGVVIAFPQLDVHIDGIVSSAPSIATASEP